VAALLQRGSFLRHLPSFNRPPVLIGLLFACPVSGGPEAAGWAALEWRCPAASEREGRRKGHEVVQHSNITWITAMVYRWSIRVRVRFD
jgi:hypothetical protein